MDELLRVNVPFHWRKECQEPLEIPKIKLVESPILKFPDWSKKFHVHIESSSLAMGVIITQLVGDKTNHPNAYAIRKLNKS